MLKESKVLNELWGEAMVCATYLLNRFPSKRIGDVTFEEVWSLQKPMVEHLKVFDVAYANVPKS